MGDELLKVIELSKYFPVKTSLFSRDKRYIQAASNVSFKMERETLGLVGESGSGKTTVARCILRLIEPTTGEIYFDGHDLLKLSKNELRKARRYVSMVYQDPFASLDPHMLVKDIVGEPLKANKLARGRQNEKQALEILVKVGLDSEHMRRYPHEFSGGQRQRIAIARALILNPKLVVLDEPTSALDVSVQAQILNLLADLKRDFDLGYLFISHNLQVVHHISDRIAVMYLGKIVEIGCTTEVFGSPRHPYTSALIAAAPVPDPKLHKKEAPLSDEIPSALNPPAGCRFHTRCPYAKNMCTIDEPKLRDLGNSRQVACHFAEETSLPSLKNPP